MRTLGIVVPVSRMAGKLENLSNWLPKVRNHDVEVIIVHDIQDSRSSNELKEIIRTISDTAISLVELKLGSPGLARNTGIERANSKWIMFVDSDDIVNLDEAFRLIHESDRKNQILVGSYAIKKVNRPGDRSVPNIANSKFDVAMNPGLWRMIFPTTIAQKHRFTEFRMGEDQEFILGVDFFNADVVFSQRILYTYFKGDAGQLTNSVEAISELSQVVPITISYLQKSNSKSGFYIAVVLLRQLLTEFKQAKGSKPQLLKLRFVDIGKLGLVKKMQLLLAILIITWKKVTNA